MSQYLKDLIDIHNSQVEERKQFVLGRVTVTDSNDSLYRYSNYNNDKGTFERPPDRSFRRSILLCGMKMI